MVPAVHKDFRGLFGHLVVAQHHVVALDADLAVAVLAGIDDLCVEHGQHAACGCGVGQFSLIRVERCDRGAFRQAVTLYGAESQVAEEIRDDRIHGRAARDDGAQLSAENIQDLTHKFGDQIETDLLRKFIDLQDLRDGLVLALLLDILVNGLIQRLENGGHAEEQRGLDLLQVLLDVL